MTTPPEDPPSSTVQESASSASNKPQTLSAWIRRPQAIVFTLIGLFILTCGIYISLGYRHFESTRRNALLADKTMANLLAVVIEEHERAVIGILQSYAGRPLFIEIVKRKDPVAARRHLAELKKQHEIDFTLVTDKNGVSWANYPVFPEVIGKDLSHLDWYKGISSNWKPYISTVLKLVVLDKPLAIVICVPVFDEKGRPIGILSSSQRLTFLSDIIQQVPFNPYTGVTVIDRTGHILYNNKYPQQKENTEYASYSIIEQALKERRQQVELTDPQKGQAKSYLAVVPIEGIGWTVIVERGLKDIFRSEYKNYIMTGAFPLLLFLLVSFFLVYSRKVFLFRKTEELLQAEVRFRSLFESMSSGVTIYQATDDGEDFIILDHNEAAQRITHVYKDFIGKSVSALFPGVKDFGLLQVFQQVWRTGKAEFFPSALYKDDRLTYWAENYVYKLPSGEIVTIFDDVTEHKQAEDDLQESEEKYRVFFETSRDCVFITSKDGSWIDFNDAAVQFFGYESRDELKEVKIQHLYHDEQDRKRHTQEITQRRFSRDYAVDLRKKDGSIIHTLITSVPKKDKSGEIIGYQGTIKDVTDQRRAEEVLKEAFNFLQQLIDALPMPLFYKDSKGIYLGCNKAFEQFFGRKRGEITGKSVYDISPKELAGIYHEQDMALLQSQGVQIYESSVNDTGGVHHDVIFHKATFPNVDGSVGGLIGAILDITERKQAEQSQALVNRILEILNNPGEIINLIRNILLLLKEHTGIEAIGVRLREAEDFPYYETNGFPPHFIESEKYLCARDDAGEIMCDSHGIPCLECICGNVICGRTDPALPFFTEGGSFWTNSTTKLLASATEEDRKTWTRNRCHSEGYESVALIPLRSGEEIIGLLQLNDKQPDRFTLGMIQSLEGIGTSIGIALHRLQAEQAIGKSEEKYRLVVDNAAEAIIITQDEKLVFVNSATEDIIGYSAAILTSRSFIDFIHPDDRNTVVGYHIKRLKGEEVPIVYDFRVVCQDGTVKWLEQKGVVIQWDKRPATLNFLSDITERKRAEDELRDSEEKYRSLASTADLMFLVDRDCRYLFMNERYAERFDLPIEKFIGRIYGDFHSEEITKTFSQIIGTVLRTRESVQHEYKSDRDGRFFLQTLTPVKDREGKAITAVTVLSKDITERKEAEKALRQAEADYRSIFENSQEGIYRSTSEGKFIAANQSMANILGYDSSRGSYQRHHRHYPSDLCISGRPSSIIKDG